MLEEKLQDICSNRTMEIDNINAAPKQSEASETAQYTHTKIKDP
jgi:hypothetical protein